MADSTFAEHVTNTNTRLASIKASLIESSTFPEACVELTKWCSDQRAFTAHFEDNLMHALQVAMENGTKENYDFNLTHSLVSACFSHRKHLSKPSANRISRWYEQMRRLKKNGGKRKRAPPKPKEPPANVPPNGPTPGLTSPDGAPTENNFMFSPGSDSSMWSAGGPMAAPGSSGHMQPGAPFPGPMGPPQAGMHSYGGQMPLPYGQMEGNHAMYDQRMIPNRAGRPGTMPDYPQVPMGQAPGAGAMMRMPVQYPAGHPQMPGHPPLQYGQMMRAPPVSVYGSMNHPQPFPVTAHPNPAPPSIHPDVRAMYELYVFKVERDLVEEGKILPGNHGCDAMITPESMQILESPDWDVLLSVWQFVKGNTTNITFSVWVNQTEIMNNNNMSEQVSISIKQFLRSGVNLIQFGYHSDHQMHRFCCEIVRRISVTDLRRLAIQQRPDFSQHNRAAYAQMAAKRQAGIISIPLNCSVSKKRMLTPVRHNECKKGLFDLGALVNQHIHNTRYLCHHCNVYFKFSDIVVDYFLLGLVQHIPMGVNELIVDKNGMYRVGEMEKEEKSKRGKKRSEESNGIKRIKSETFVKQEPGVFPDMHGRIPFSPMTMPGSVPPDWSRLQSPTFSMNSPSKIQLGPATPATPGLVLQNPASAGSMLNMSSPRQTMLPLPHPMMHHPEPVIAGSAPYTPESVKGDKLDALMQIPPPELYPKGKVVIMHDERLVSFFLKGTNDVKFDEIDTAIYEETANNQPEGTQPLLAPGSSSSNGSTFTPPFDDIHLGNRASH